MEMLRMIEKQWRCALMSLCFFNMSRRALIYPPCILLLCVCVRVGVGWGWGVFIDLWPMGEKILQYLELLQPVAVLSPTRPEHVDFASSICIGSLISPTLPTSEHAHLHNKPFQLSSDLVHVLACPCSCWAQHYNWLSLWPAWLGGWVEEPRR